MKKNNKTPFRFQQTTPQQCEQLLKKLDKNKAIGVDLVHTLTIIDSADILAPYISHIFNLCIKCGIFPQNLKPARVTPLFKKGDPFDRTNYRPVSILITLSKIFERLILNQMMEYMLQNNIITKSQYGFLQKISTKTALLNFHEELLQQLDKKDMVGLGIFIDLAKAFDTVNHEILLKKLEIYGVESLALKLISSYLSNRQQTVVIDGIHSYPRTIMCGVPQGSILGPFFFILYINDLPNALKHTTPTMFADDTTLQIFHTDILTLRDLCLEDLTSLSTWCKLNLLTLNASKTGYLLFSSSNRKLPDQFPTNNLPENSPSEHKQK
eukprot:Lithocolla_globosa_v1_NODE_5747_length_1190_cov_17.937500.p1 type:complete len:325 gc:universal NODE_5747_length_1190_cov_17.937500:982-8(-)